MTLETITARLRSQLGDARVAEAEVHTACQDIRTQGNATYLAATYLDAGPCDAPLTAAREIMDDALRRFADIRRAVDSAELGLAHESERTREPDPEARIIVATIRSIAEVAEGLGAEVAEIGTLAAARVRDFAEFDSLHVRVGRDLDVADLDSVDDGLARLRALEAVLVSTATTSMVEELTWRRMLLDPLLNESRGG